MSEVLTFPNISETDIEKLWTWSDSQDGNAVCLVHPFFNVLTTPYWAHKERSQKQLRQSLFIELNKRDRGEQSSQKIRDLLTHSKIMRHENRVTQKLLNNSHNQYYEHLNRFLANTSLQYLAIFEETANLTYTEDLIRAFAYQGNLLFFPSIEANAIPDGYEYWQIARLLTLIETKKLVIGGQNSWVENNLTENRASNKYPFVISPLQNSSVPELLLGCVGYFFKQINRSLAQEQDASGAKIPTIQLSSLSWPQRRDTDPTNRGKSGYNHINIENL